MNDGHIYGIFWYIEYRNISKCTQIVRLQGISWSLSYEEVHSKFTKFYNTYLNLILIHLDIWINILLWLHVHEEIRLFQKFLGHDIKIRYHRGITFPSLLVCYSSTKDQQNSGKMTSSRGLEGNSIKIKSTRLYLVLSSPRFTSNSLKITCITGPINLYTLGIKPIFENESCYASLRGFFQ